MPKVSDLLRCAVTPQAKEYIERIREEFLSGNDSAVYSIMVELNENIDLYCEVFSVFPASMRRQLKEIQIEYRPKS